MTNAPSNAAPPISPVTGSARPLISVIIPTYNTSRFLEQTLRSVLDQQWPVNKMEIAVVDDCSPKENPEALVQSVGQGRIVFHRNSHNLGISGNFNRCLELARGHWVHILHSDDFVHPGFYSEFESIIDQSPVDAISFNTQTVDDTGKVLGVNHDLSGLTPGQLRPFFLRGTPIECSGVIVKREVYEQIGGFLPQFKYLLDIEMWTRIFFNFPTFFCGKPLVSFRWHPASAGARLRKAGADSPEFYAFAPYLKANMRLNAREERLYRKRAHRFLNDTCRELAKAGDGRTWLAIEKLYARHLDHPLDAIDFLLRFNRNFGWYIRRKLSGVSRTPDSHD